MLTPRKRVAVLAALAVLALVTLAMFHQHLRLTFTPLSVRTNATTARFLPLLPGHHDDHHHHHDPPQSTNLSATVRHEATHVAVAGKDAPTVPQKKRKRIVYSCSGGCGGWADRQKGIVGAYVLASMLDRDFGVYITFPCELSRLLDEGTVHWKVTPNQVAVTSSKVYTKLDSQAVDFTQKFLTEKDLERYFPEDVTVFTWNMEVVQYLQQHEMASRLDWVRGRSFPEVYQRALRDLFVLKPPLQKALDDLKNARPPGTQLVCAQVRMGKHNGSFPDVESWHTFDQFPILVDFLAKYNDSRRYRLFFASDSVEILQRARSRFPGVYLDIPGPITHTDKSQGAQACEGFKKAVLDEYALSLCDVLVISESGIGKMASFMRGSDQELYLFHDVKIEPFTRGGSFPNKAGW